ncbi:putative ficolin-2-like [Apostichopus japonicus]|uniref:Putative ficolin-2-like n=1 Tax=Stichopus japonicus TaxID=307972 RepID=A0A2G8JQM7_STIJA|nr:putative ficolin-2-like [Apostichopus japonicus]
MQARCTSNTSSGVFLIKPDGYWEPFQVYCDNPVNSKGWTIIQRRFDGAIDFNRDWDSYKSGFGFLNQEFWLGNEKLSFLTNQKRYEIMIEMTTASGSVIEISYDDFRISDKLGNYSIVHLGKYSVSTDVITWCQHNMIIENCENACQRTCETPGDCQEDSCVRSNGCVCPHGFLMNGSDCVPQEQCGCYVSDDRTVIPEGGFYVTSGCRRKGVCTNGQIDWEEDFSCSPNAVFQRRQDGSVDFFLLWASYKEGFGNLSTEFWIGNDKLYYLTNQKRYEIRIDLVNREYNSYYGKFDFFRINDESDNYRLSGLGTYSGTVDERSSPDGDFLRYHLNQEFSTQDNDNDAYSNNCADYYRAGWWYNKCHYSNLNGDYNAYLDSYSSIGCYNIPGPNYNIKYSEMKIRPV